MNSWPLIDVVALDGTSLKGTRLTKEFLALLKMVINPDNFHLETLQTREIVDADGVIGPGDYLAGEPI
jgi:hypothetical protein